MKERDHVSSEFDSPSQWYNYKCVSCKYETEIEDIVVDAYFYSQGCKTGQYPKFTCPKCHNTMNHVGF